MRTTLDNQSQAIENAMNQGMEAASSALMQPAMLMALAVVFGPPLIVLGYKLINFLSEDPLALAVFWEWNSNNRKK